VGEPPLRLVAARQGVLVPLALRALVADDVQLPAVGALALAIAEEVMVRSDVRNDPALVQRLVPW
jgi:hypothetical protein